MRSGCEGTGKDLVRSLTFPSADLQTVMRSMEGRRDTVATVYPWSVSVTCYTLSGTGLRVVKLI